MPPLPEDELTVGMQYLLEPEADEEAAADPNGDPDGTQMAEDDDGDDDSIDLARSQAGNDEIDDDSPPIIQRTSKRGHDTDASGSQMPP